MKSHAVALALVLALPGCGSPPRATPAAPPPVASTLPARADSAYVAALKAKLGGRPLSLDSRLQAAAEDALRATGKAGGIVAFDPNDGRVEALFSVAGDRGDPLLVPHRPASTFKSFMTLAGVRAGVLDENTELTCDGGFDFAGVRLTCPKQHGRENPVRALTVSCNAFYYQVAAKLDPEVVRGVTHELELDARTGIELDDAPGILPPSPAKKGTPEHPRPLVDAVGHGDYQVTLLGLARAYGALATGGTLVEPRVVRGHLASPKRVPLDPKALAIVQQGMRAAVANDEGSAHDLALPGFPFSGKTGSDDPPPRAGAAGDTEEVDSWFVAFAPPEKPSILVAARVERGVPREAAKVARQVLLTLAPGVQ